ncbi:MAG: dihydrodipicolinate synthase family protein, partial [Sphaerochaetaceae bacterium]|nr:dihydrodipicolinate synthase family protein [Sphaerochaetaceae bacterium]
ENLTRYCDLRKETPDFEVYTGPDHMIHDGLLMGATGCVSGLANVIPAWVNDIVRLYAEGDVAGSAAAQAKVTEFRTELYRYGFPPALVKRALYVMDPAVGNNRMPALIPSKEIDDTLKTLLETYGLL